MLKFFVSLLIWIVFSGSAFASQPFTAPGHTTPITVFQNGYSTVTIQVTGTGSGMTYVAQGINTDGLAVTLPMIPAGCGSSVASASANGNYYVSVAGYWKFQVNLSAIGGGTANIATAGAIGPSFGCALTNPS